MLDGGHYLQVIDASHPLDPKDVWLAQSQLVFPLSCYYVIGEHQYKHLLQTRSIILTC